MFGAPKWIAYAAAAIVFGVIALIVLGEIKDARKTATELATTKADLKDATAALRAAEVAKAVYRAHLDREAKRNQEIDEFLQDLQSMEGRDAPLSPLLRATADRLYSTP